MGTFNSVDEVKRICKERKIPISKLEQACGFSNGYVGKLREGKFPADRLYSISQFLGVSVDYLMTGEEPKVDLSAGTAKLVGKLVQDPEMAKALRKYFELSDEKKKHVIETINMLSEV
jgi:transcriptional regulator with XRE-family HTH domain|nr:MAG TPA: repressor protein [Bacteriophage sp.]